LAILTKSTTAADIHHSSNTHYPAIPAAISHYLCPNQLLSTIHSCYPSSTPTIISHPQSLSTICRCCPSAGSGVPICRQPAIISHYPAIMYPYTSIYTYIYTYTHIHTSIYTISAIHQPSAHPGSGVRGLDLGLVIWIPCSTAAIHGVYMC
jgi:hypothetical protein